MTRPHSDSIIERGANSTRIEEGRITNVNMARWTIDARTRESQRTYYDIKWSSPYLHFNSGEGINFMPEVGAKVMVCRPASSDPFVMCFVTPHEESARQADETGAVPPVDNHPTGNEGSVDDDGDAGTGPANVTFRAGRPALQQGDIHLSTRDGNQIWLHRGGVVEIGSTAISKRLYIPLLNFIRDSCENYELLTAGGTLSWTVERNDQNSDDEAMAILSIVGRNAAQDTNASVMLQMGHVDDTKKLRLVVAPKNINPQTLEVSGSAVYTLDVDEEGTVVEGVKKDWNLTVEGEVTWDVTGSVTYTYGSNVTETISGNQETTVTGNHTLDAASSTERLSGGKSIDSSDINLGGTAVMKVVIASTALISYIQTHKHTAFGVLTSPPDMQIPALAYSAKKVKAQ